jgi:hypothetical protein
MRSVHSLLAIYGAIDRMVLEAGPESETAAIVERYMPGTTGANAGWFDEIRNFLNLPASEVPLPEFESVDRSIEILVEEHNGTSDSDSDSDSDSHSEESEPLTKSELSRLAFAIGVFSRLPGREPRVTDEWLVQGLTLAAPAESNKIEVAGQLFDLLQANFEQRDDWPTLMMRASSDGLIDPTVALVPLCRTKLRYAHGQNCVVLTTEFTIPQPQPGVDVDKEPPGKYPSLDDLKAIVDPVNWDDCLPFFCEMKALTPPKRGDGWSRILEITSTTCGVYGTPRMKTPLKYWKGPRKEDTGLGTPLVAWVNYELDDTPANPYPGDGLVLVDEGFIKMYALNLNSGAPGVRVVTKKVVCFRYLSEVAIAILACVSGYGNQGVDMLLDGVAKYKNPKHTGDFTPWEPSEPPATGSTTADSTEPPDVSIPTDPNRTSRRAILLAVEMATECIDEFSAKSTAIAGKVATGPMPITDMIALNAEFMTRLATDPWRYLERLRADFQGGDK